MSIGNPYDHSKDYEDAIKRMKIQRIERPINPPVIFCAKHYGHFNFMNQITCPVCKLKEILGGKMEETLIEKAYKLLIQKGYVMDANQESLRTKILLEANKLTSGDRDKAYGPPIDNLSTYADLCSTYLAALPDPKKLDATDGSILMILAKISRIPRNKLHRDNYVDGAAYMAIAGECTELLEKTRIAGAQVPIHGRNWQDGPRDFTKGEFSQ